MLIVVLLAVRLGAMSYREGVLQCPSKIDGVNNPFADYLILLGISRSYLSG